MQSIQNGVHKSIVVWCTPFKDASTQCKEGFQLLRDHLGKDGTVDCFYADIDFTGEDHQSYQKCLFFFS